MQMKHNWRMIVDDRLGKCRVYWCEPCDTQMQIFDSGMGMANKPLVADNLGSIMNGECRGSKNL